METHKEIEGLIIWNKVKGKDGLERYVTFTSVHDPDQRWVFRLALWRVSKDMITLDT